MSIDQIARAAGFRKAGETQAVNTDNSHTRYFGMDIVTDPTMPEGFVAIRNERGAVILGPKGAHWVPFYPNLYPARREP